MALAEVLMIQTPKLMLWSTNGPELLKLMVWFLPLVLDLREDGEVLVGTLVQCAMALLGRVVEQM
jgi:hypothetical protein